jgi:hypothetical protein
MRFGINTFPVTSPFTSRSARLFPRFKHRGYGCVEIESITPDVKVIAHAAAHPTAYRADAGRDCGEQVALKKNLK